MPVIAVVAVTVGWFVGLAVENSAVSPEPGVPPLQLPPVDQVELLAPLQMGVAADAETVITTEAARKGVSFLIFMVYGEFCSLRELRLIG